MVEYRITGEERETVYRIEEESADLIPLRVPAIEVTRAEPQPPIPALIPETPIEESHAAEAQRPGIRLRVFEAIDEFDPALDEDLQLGEEPDGMTAISGIVPSADRKAQLESLLAAQSGVRATVLTQSEAIAEAIASLGPQPVPNPDPQIDRESPAAASGEAIRSEDPLLAGELAARFGSDDQGNALAMRFGAAVLEETQHLAFRARWLQRLETAFSARDWQALPAGERERLLALRAKWRSALRDRHHALQQRVAAILCPVPCPDPGTSAALPADPAGLPESVPAEIPHWKPLLDEELALLKTMFVDGAFAQAGTAQQAKSQWTHTSQTTSQALDSPQPWPPQHALASTASGFTPQAP
jgi:hypothetical protein